MDVQNTDRGCASRTHARPLFGHLFRVCFGLCALAVLACDPSTPPESVEDGVGETGDAGGQAGEFPNTDADAALGAEGQDAEGATASGGAGGSSQQSGGSSSQGGVGGAVSTGGSGGGQSPGTMLQVNAQTVEPLTVVLLPDTRLMSRDTWEAAQYPKPDMLPDFFAFVRALVDKISAKQRIALKLARLGSYSGGSFQRPNPIDDFSAAFKAKGYGDPTEWTGVDGFETLGGNFFHHRVGTKGLKELWEGIDLPSGQIGTVFLNYAMSYADPGSTGYQSGAELAKMLTTAKGVAAKNSVVWIARFEESPCLSRDTFADAWPAIAEFTHVDPFSIYLSRQCGLLSLVDTVADALLTGKELRIKVPPGSALSEVYIDGLALPASAWAHEGDRLRLNTLPPNFNLESSQIRVVRP